MSARPRGPFTFATGLLEGLPRIHDDLLTCMRMTEIMAPDATTCWEVTRMLGAVVRPMSHQVPA